MLICDTPAKSYVLYLNSHMGYYSCTKCVQEGDMVHNTMCFPELTNHKTTDTSFRNRTQPEHHKGKSNFECLPNFNMIDNVPIDYMHCVLLGVTKRLLCGKKFGWVYGKPPFKLCARDINAINCYLVKLRNYIPVEFARKPRSLNDCKRFKATEFRLFLLYTGPVVLKDVLPSKMYNNFMVFCVAISILIQKTPKTEMIDYADNLLKYFVSNSIKIYGHHFVTHNVHHLIHLSDCVRIHGNLNHFSAFPFENFTKKLLSNVRKSS